MKTLLYIVRHGHSKGNEERIFYGHYDGMLSEIGEKQSNFVAQYFSDKKIDAVYSSDLQRAVNTVKSAADMKNLAVVKDIRLRELYAGKWENQRIETLETLYPHDYGDVWHNDKANSRCTGGESVRELQTRVYNAVKDIADKNQGKSIIISTHATPIWTLYAAFTAQPLENINTFPFVPNASVTEAIYQDGKWDIVSYGNTDHLKGIITKTNNLF